MSAVRLTALTFFAVLAVYYARFFIMVEHGASTIVQILLLVIAAAVAVLPLPASWRPTPFQTWLPWLGAVGLSAAIFVLADQSSHSVSDTLTRAVPGICVIFTVAARVAPPVFIRARSD